MLRNFTNYSMPQRLASYFSQISTYHKRLIMVVIVVVVLLLGFRFISPLITIIKQEDIKPAALYDLAVTDKSPLKSTNGRTNVVLLGMGGSTHEGPDLTDSILVASLDLQGKEKDIALIPIPRDTWSPTLQDKINSAYHYGELKKKGGGLILAKSIAEEITGLPIHYGVTLDFAGFTQIIDLLGGVDVYVERSFTDEQFPIPGKENDECDGDKEFKCRYKTVSFQKGWIHMNGTQALEFVRSRHSIGSEGNDYSRSERQQKIIVAVKDKVLKDKVFLNPSKMQEIKKQVDSSIETDLIFTDLLYLAKVARGVDNQNLKQFPLIEGGAEGTTAGFLINPPIEDYDGRWVLAPEGDNFTPIHTYLVCVLTNPQCTMKLPALP